MDTVDKVQDRLNPEPQDHRHPGHDVRPAHHARAGGAHRVIEAFGDLVFDAVINRTVRFPETTVAGEPITTWAPTSAGAQAYRLLAREVLAR